MKSFILTKEKFAVTEISLILLKIMIVVFY